VTCGPSLQKDRKLLRIGTWNVRTMLKRGKLRNVKVEMRRMKINILGLSEVRWRDGGDFMSDDVRVIYAGGEESQRGVAVLLDSDTAKRVTKIMRCSDRIILIKIAAEPVDLIIVQVYMPTSDQDEQDVESLYESIEDLIKKERGKDYVVVMGDWNAVVGEGRDEGEIGSLDWGKGIKEDR
jgi:exonuclease III